MKKVRGKTDFECGSVEFHITVDELEKVAKDIIGQPIYDGTDHTSVDKIVGRVTKAWVEDGAVIYEAEIKDKETLDAFKSTPTMATVQWNTLPKRKTYKHRKQGVGV